MNITVQTTGLKPDSMIYDLRLDRDEFKALYFTLVRYLESQDPNDEIDFHNGYKMFKDIHTRKTAYILKHLELIGAKE